MRVIVFYTRCLFTVYHYSSHLSFVMNLNLCAYLIIYDNAVAERLNGILKSEYRISETFPNYKTALAQLVKAV
ncbi:MAG: hypothetical protein K0R59_3546 [Sphingobacterium sp.]|jgi:hypothetical protein|nr:hypothetical protein [Sphingobacterium sp.]